MLPYRIIDRQDKLFISFSPVFDDSYIDWSCTGNETKVWHFSSSELTYKDIYKSLNAKEVRYKWPRVNTIIYTLCPRNSLDKSWIFFWDERSFITLKLQIKKTNTTNIKSNLSKIIITSKTSLKKVLLNQNFSLSQ